MVIHLISVAFVAAALCLPVARFHTPDSSRPFAKPKLLESVPSTGGPMVPWSLFVSLLLTSYHTMLMFVKHTGLESPYRVRSHAILPTVVLTLLDHSQDTVRHGIRIVQSIGQIRGPSAPPSPSVVHASGGVACLCVLCTTTPRSVHVASPRARVSRATVEYSHCSTHPRRPAPLAARLQTNPSTSLRRQHRTGVDARRRPHLCAPSADS